MYEISIENEHTKCNRIRNARGRLTKLVTSHVFSAL